MRIFTSESINWMKKLHYADRLYFYTYRNRLYKLHRLNPTKYTWICLDDEGGIRHSAKYGHRCVRHAILKDGGEIYECESRIEYEQAYNIRTTTARFS